MMMTKNIPCIKKTGTTCYREQVYLALLASVERTSKSVSEHFPFYCIQLVGIRIAAVSM